MFKKLGPGQGMLSLGGLGKNRAKTYAQSEIGVTFFSVSGSEFVEMFVGLGAARLRGLFSMSPLQSLLSKLLCLWLNGDAVVGTTRLRDMGTDRIIPGRAGV